MDGPAEQYQLVTETKAIADAQRRLESLFRSVATWSETRALGFHGGKRDAEVFWIESEQLWYACPDRKENRWHNGFGLQDPRTRPLLSITVWINPPKDGVGPQAGAAFLRGADGHLYLAHAGRLGGSKKGVGRRAFLEWLRTEAITIEERSVLVVADLDSPTALGDIAAFVRKVDAFKSEVGASDGDDDEEGDDDDEPGRASWTLESLFAKRDAATEQVVVEWIASMIRHAHERSASCWALTRREGPRLRVLVGHAVAFEIGRGRIGVGLHLPSISDMSAAEGDTSKADYRFERVDGGVLRYYTLTRFMASHAELRPAAMRFVELAAAAYPNSPYARHHAPELLDEISASIGASLPHPQHSGNQAALSYWKVAPGERARLWQQCRDGGYIAIGWDELGDLGGMDRDAFSARLEETLASNPTWKKAGVQQAWRFLNIPIGARIVANDGTKRVVGIGTVTGPYQFVEDGKEFAHRLPVRWDDLRERVVDQPGWVRTVRQLSHAAFTAIVDAPSPGEQRETPRPEAKPAERLDFDGITERLVDDGLQFPAELVASYLLALQAKRFVLLSGISGTGKTQLALAVARAFQPGDASGPAVTTRTEVAGEYRIRAQPYMFKFRRMVVPSVLADLVTGEANSGRVTVRFGENGTESLRWSAQSTATQLLFKGSFREWFAQSFEAGDEMILRVEAEDPPVLRIEPVDDEPEAVARPATYEVVAVRPDWTDNRGLLGYHNPITREYHATPFLRLLLAASEEDAVATRQQRPRLPYFVVLDEMNLARVEHYFSDFLSCLESGEPLHLHDDPIVEEGASGSGEAVPMRLRIPTNLFFTGTVNVDETTYMFSPKVLDRAFVLEFNDVDLDAFGAEPEQGEVNDSVGLRLANFEGSLDIRDRPDLRDWEAFRSLADGALHRALVRLNDRLQAEHRHFGYRVANEIARFVGLAAEQVGRDLDVLWEVFDIAIVSKVLPKLHGTQQEIEDILSRLFAFAVDVDAPSEARGGESSWVHSGSRLVPKDTQTVPRLPRAAVKLWRMLRRVRQQGYVSFIE